MNQRPKIKAMDADGMTRTAIAEKLGISERSVYRALLTTSAHLTSQPSGEGGD
jgi:hypothetical protein